MSFTPIHLFFDDVQVDQAWDSLGRTVTEADIVNFAGLSGDFNPIHLDHEFAKTTAFRKLPAPPAPKAGTKQPDPPTPEAREIIHPITSAGGACIVRFGQIEPSRSRCAKPFPFENRRIAGATPVGRVDESQSPTRPLLHVAGETVDTRVWRDRCAHLGSRSRSYRRHSVYCL